MKYESEGTKRITLTQQAFAETPREAAQLFLKEHGQMPETVCEVTEDEDAEVICHEVITACESCGLAVFDGEKYYPGEDADVCEKCGDEMITHESKPQVSNAVHNASCSRRENESGNKALADQTNAFINGGRGWG